MSKTTLSFVIDDKKKKALDQIAETIDRDRSYVLNEAVANYLDLHQWQFDHIKEGLKQSRKGQYASESKVKAFFKKWENAKD